MKRLVERIKTTLGEPHENVRVIHRLTDSPAPASRAKGKQPTEQTTVRGF